MTPEKRILDFIDYLKNSETIRFKREFYLATGISRQYAREVAIGNNRFTSTHISSICRNYPINANWIFGVEDNMFRGAIKKGTQKNNLENN